MRVNIRQRFFSNIRGDLFGGITAGVVALPLALGFGVASGLENGAAIGMYGAIAVGVMAAIFGGTASQISGPTGPMTVVVAGLAAELTGDPAWIFVMVALAGLFQVGMGVLRLGSLIRYVPYPVISGFMTGIGVIVIVLQFGALLGHAPASSPLTALAQVPTYLAAINFTALAIGVMTIAVIYLTPRLTQVVPGTLIALAGMTVLSMFAPGEVPRIGSIPRGLPSIHLPEITLEGVGMILFPALALAVIGAIDSLLTSLVADNVTKTRHDSDQELVGQGIGNTLAGLIGGLPGAGATMRTVVNVRSGGRERLSGVVHGLLLLSLLVVLGPLAERIPNAVLAGILFTVGVGIMDKRGLGHIASVPRGDAAVMLVVLGLTVFVDLMWAVAAGMILASLILVKRLAGMDPAARGSLSRRASGDAASGQQAIDGASLVELSGSLFFGNCRGWQREVEDLADAGAVVMDMQKLVYLDQSGAYAIADALERLELQGMRVYVAGLHSEPATLLAKLGFVPGVCPPERVLSDLPSAVSKARADAGGAAANV